MLLYSLLELNMVVRLPVHGWRGEGTHGESGRLDRGADGAGELDGAGGVAVDQD